MKIGDFLKNKETGETGTIINIVDNNLFLISVKSSNKVKEFINHNILINKTDLNKFWIADN